MSYNWTIIYNDQIAKRSCTLSPGTAQVHFSMAPSHTLPLMLPAPFNWVTLLLTAWAIQLPHSCGWEHGSLMSKFTLRWWIEYLVAGWFIKMGVYFLTILGTGKFKHAKIGCEENAQFPRWSLVFDHWAEGKILLFIKVAPRINTSQRVHFLIQPCWQHLPFQKRFILF